MATSSALPRRLRPSLRIALAILIGAAAAAGPGCSSGTSPQSSPASSPGSGQTPTAQPAPTTVAGTALTWNRVSDPSFGGPGDQVINAMSESSGRELRFVLGGYSDHDGSVWVSADGATWQKSQEGLGGPGDQVINGVAGGTTLTAVGKDTSTGNSDAAVWTSADGRTWQRVADPALGGPGDQVIYRVSNTTFGQIAGGSDSRNGDADAAFWIHRSGAWQEVTGGALGGTGNQIVYRVKAIGNKLVAVGTDDGGGDLDAAIWVSPDAVNWLRVEDRTGDLGGEGDQGLLDVLDFGNVIVAGGFTSGPQDKDGALWQSADGLTWTAVLGQPDLGGTGDQVINRLFSGIPGFKFAAFGFDTSSGDSDAAVWLSLDGSTLQHEAILGGPGDQRIQSVAAAGALVVLVGYDSAGGDLDGSVWTAELGE